jgi:CheY-like chemotaxis protein
MEARTGEEALQNLHGFDPDLILLDINMPGMGDNHPRPHLTEARRHLFHRTRRSSGRNRKFRE